MNNKNMSRILLCSILILSALALIGCGDQSLKALDPDESLVAYVCSKGDFALNICVTNLDGSAWKYIEIDDQDFGGAFYVEISDSGQVLFTCAKESYKLCVFPIDDPSRMRMLEIDREVGEFSHINDAGQTVQICEDSVKSDLSEQRLICSTNISTSETNVLAQVEGNGSFPQINDENWIAFLCQDKESGFWTGLCIIRSDGTDFRVLLEGESINKFAMNNLGQIFHTCNVGLCVSAIDETPGKQFDQKFRSKQDDFMPAMSSRIDINDIGDLLVFFSSIEIFVSNVNNDEFRRVEGSPESALCCAAINNEGWIVFHCSFESDTEGDVCSKNPVTGEVKRISVPKTKPHMRRLITVSH